MSQPPSPAREANLGSTRRRLGVTMLEEMWQRVEARLPAPRLPPIPETDHVALDARRHPVVLAVPAVRTLLGFVVVLSGARPLLLLLVFAVVVGMWGRQRLRSGLRSTALLGAGGLVGLLLLGGSGGLRLLLGVGLLLWFVEEVADWYADRLIATNKRLYRLYGVVTTHSPSMALTGIVFLESQQGVVGRMVGYGTVMLDSAAQDDKTLSRFDYLPDPQRVHLRLLELRSAALPKYPPATS